jgi:hypothetical protein
MRVANGPHGLQSTRLRNFLKQSGIQTSALWRYPRIALWDARATEDTVVAANIIHLPLTR